MTRDANAYPGDVDAKLSSFDKALDSHWGDWVSDAEDWFAVQAGDQWPKEALEQFEIDGRTAIVFNRVDPTIDAISGAEINNRQEVRYAPRELGDVQVNELLTGAVKWSRDECDAGDEESQAFRDTLICGLGATETRMNYDDDEEGAMLISRIAPLELKVDPASRKPNFVDARYFRWERRYDRSEAETLFPELCVYGQLGPSREEGAHENNPRDAYDGKHSHRELPDDMVEVCEYQWWEFERLHNVLNPMTGEIETLTQDEFEEVEKLFAQSGVELDSATFRKKRFWRAFRCKKAGETLVEPLPDGEFTVKFITGKFDEITGLPYGAVKAMVDPQRWMNKFLAQTDRLIAGQAKGGVILDKGAFEDPEQVEADWAKGGAVHWAEEGSLAQTVMVPKPQSQMPAAWDRLVQYAAAALTDVVGVNKEMLGQADRQQPGVLEFQRKQAAYGVLANYFDHMTRYRKVQGRLHLKLVQKYMTDGRLIRITGEEGKDRYVQLLPALRDPQTARFDVIVDETPAGPNQQERVWNMLMGLGPVMKALQGLPPDVMLTILEYSPLPSSLIAKLRDFVQKSAAPDPQAQQAQAMQQQFQMAQAQQTLAKGQADINKTNADAALAGARAQSEGAKTENDRARLSLDAQEARLDAAQSAQEMQLRAAEARERAIERVSQPLMFGPPRAA